MNRHGQWDGKGTLTETKGRNVVIGAFQHCPGLRTITSHSGDLSYTWK